MRILVIGAGALGGFFGAHLLAARRDVTFLVRPRRAQQLLTQSLQLSGPKGDLRLPSPPTVTAGQLNQTFDLILLSCKAYDLPAAIDDFAPAFGPQTLILPLLNGMAHLTLLDQRFGPSHVLGGTSMVSAARDDSGRILHLNDLDDLYFGHRDNPAEPRLNLVAEALTVPGFSAELRPDILEDLWHKWLAIAAGAGLTCLLRCAVADIVAANAIPFVHQLLAETSSISAAEGFPAHPRYLAAILARFTDPASLFTASMLRDIESNNPIESNQIIGDLLTHARRHSLPTPLLEVVHAHLRCYEARRHREQVAPAPSSQK